MTSSLDIITLEECRIKCLDAKQAAYLEIIKGFEDSGEELFIKIAEKMREVLLDLPTKGINN